MTAVASLIPELDDIVRNGDPKRRAEAAGRIAELFFQDAARLRPDHVDLFDGILIDLVPCVETMARAELAERFAQLANAPRGLVGQLARESEILVAGPVLRRSPVLEEAALLEIARLKGQDHLLAMAERKTLSPGLTDVLLHRGDRKVVRRAAGNAGASFSDSGYADLIQRAAGDGVLTLTIGQRDDLSESHLKALLAATLDPVRRRLFDLVKPQRRAEITQASAGISGEPERIENRHDFDLAQRTIQALQHDGYLNEGALLGFAKAHKYEEAVAALSAMSGVSVAVLHRLISGDGHDAFLIIGKTIGLEWATVRALILLRMGFDHVPSQVDIETARANFARLMPSTAERVVNFWKARAAL